MLKFDTVKCLNDKQPNYCILFHIFLDLSKYIVMISLESLMSTYYLFLAIIRNLTMNQRYGKADYMHCMTN